MLVPFPISSSKFAEIITTQLNTKLGGALAVKQIWIQIQPLETTDHASRFWFIFENSQNCRQSIGALHRSIFHAVKSSRMPYTAKHIKNIYYPNQRIETPLELRHAPPTKADQVLMVFLPQSGGSIHMWAWAHGDHFDQCKWWQHTNQRKTHIAVSTIE